MAAGDDAAAGGRGVVPVLHVVGLGQADGTGVAHVVPAHGVFDFLGRLSIHEVEAPAFGPTDAVRVPHGDGFSHGAATLINHVGEDTASTGDDVLAFELLHLRLVGLAEVLLDPGHGLPGLG